MSEVHTELPGSTVLSAAAPCIAKPLQRCSSAPALPQQRATRNGELTVTKGETAHTSTASFGGLESLPQQKACEWLTAWLAEANLEQPSDIECRIDSGIKGEGFNSKVTRDKRFTGVLVAKFSSPSVVKRIIHEVYVRDPTVTSSAKVWHIWCKPFGYPSVSVRNPWRPTAWKHDEAVDTSVCDSQLMSGIQSRTFLRSPWGRQVTQLGQSLSTHGRQNPKKVKHRKSGGFKKAVGFEMYSWEALVGEPMQKERLTLEDAKILASELRSKGCVGFMVEGRPSSWRQMEIHFMSKWETEKRDRWYCFGFADVKPENKLLKKVRGEMEETIQLQAIETSCKREAHEDGKELSRLVDQGRAMSTMHQLGSAVREVDAQHQALRGAQRRRIEALRAARATKAKSTAIPPPTVDLEDCRAAIHKAERVVREVYQKQQGASPRKDAGSPSSKKNTGGPVENTEQDPVQPL